MFKIPLVRMAGYVILSLLVAIVTYGCLKSTGDIVGKNYILGGAITGYLIVFIIMIRFDARNYQIKRKDIEQLNVDVNNLFNSERLIARAISSEDDYKTYNQTIVQCIDKASNSLLLYYHMIRPSSDGIIPKDINDAIKSRAQRGNIHITVVTAAEYDRLAGAYELNTIPNVSIYFSKDLRMSDLSFTLIDNSIVVFGVKKDNITPPKYDPSDEWIMLESIKLGGILLSHVETILESAFPYDEFVLHTINDYMRGDQGSIPLAAEQLSLPQSEIERFFSITYKTLEKH